MKEGELAEVLPGVLCLGLIFLPRLVMDDGENGLAAAGIAVILLVLLAFLSRYMKIRRKVFYIPLFAAGILVGGLFLRLYTELISSVLLPGYPKTVIGAAMVLTLLYGTSKGNGAFARFAELSVPVLLFAALICLLPAAENADIQRLCFLPENIGSAVIQGAKTGIMLAFPLILKYTKTRKKNTKKTAFAVLAAGLLAFAAACVWQMRFSYTSRHPVLDLMYAGGSGTAFIRRQEGLILGILTFASYFMLGGVLRCAAVSLGRGRDKAGVSAVCAGLMLLLAFLPDNPESAREILCLALIAFGLLFVVLLPLWELFMQRRVIK